MSGIRLLLSDIDGTLLRPDHSLSAENIAAVHALRESGVLFSIASSRPPRAMRLLIDSLHVDLPTVAFNGANIVNPDGSLLAAHRLDPQAARTSLDLFGQHPVAVWVFADDQWLLVDPKGDYVEHERNTLGYDPVLVERFTPWLERIDKLVAASTDFELLRRLEGELNPLIAETAVAARSQRYYLDVTAREANKGAALVALARACHVDLRDTAAIGDGGNDVAMFRQAGLAIAMGQAEAHVRAAAHAVTGSNLEDGLAQAIRQRILSR